MKNGIPLVTRQWHPDEKVPAAHVDETMVTGFLSAMADFIAEMKSYGEMEQIQTSDSDRFTFYKPAYDPDLLFVVRSEIDLDPRVCKAFLRRISARFLERFSRVLHEGWNGKTEVFRGFRDELQALDEFVPARYLQGRDDKGLEYWQRRVPAYTRQVTRDLRTGLQRRAFPRPRDSQTPPPAWPLIVPLVAEALRGETRDALARAFGLGAEARQLLTQVDGRQSVSAIARRLAWTPDRVFRECKHLVKLGLLALVAE